MNIENRIIKLERRFRTIQTKKVAEAQHIKTPPEELAELLGDPSKSRADLIELSADNIAIMAANFISVEDMARLFHISLFDMEQHLRPPDSKLRSAYKRGRAIGKYLLRQAQLKSAEKGSTKMLIFLGKQHLGQTNGPMGNISLDGGLPEESDLTYFQVKLTPELKASWKDMDNNKEGI